MASDNQITIVGNLTDDPELRYTANGAAVANFRVAYSTRIRDAAGNWTDGDTSFFTINCWRSLAEDAAGQKKQKRKICIFCKDHIDYVDYKDVITLRKFVSERGKIRARRVTGNCVQHQRDVATAVKNAREMALLPYSAR